MTFLMRWDIKVNIFQKIKHYKKYKTFYFCVFVTSEKQFFFIGHKNSMPQFWNVVNGAELNLL